MPVPASLNNNNFLEHYPSNWMDGVVGFCRCDANTNTHRHLINLCVRFVAFPRFAGWDRYLHFYGTVIRVTSMVMHLIGGNPRKAVQFSFHLCLVIDLRQLINCYFYFVWLFYWINYWIITNYFKFFSLGTCLSWTNVQSIIFLSVKTV